jgi:heme/copper-type cytochrome/quinol oxidase subunit 3
MLKAMLQYGFMAAYSCPSRKEVDEVHYRSRFLHVGSLSLDNLRGISKRKALVVLVLLLSSALFHLLWAITIRKHCNSNLTNLVTTLWLVFTYLATNEYYYYSIATEDFLTRASFDLTGVSYPLTLVT